jgi:seryl-tRNA synthetase
MTLLVNQVPNLLDDRVPEGEDEEDNQVVAEWGAEQRKLGEGFLWHDDIATKLGGYDPATAVSLWEGGRGSVCVSSVSVCLYVCLSVCPWKWVIVCWAACGAWLLAFCPLD